MQMSRLYQSTNKQVRAQQLRKDGRALALAGYQDSADQNFQLAETLDPTPREVSNPSHSYNKTSSQGRKGSGSERVFSNGDRQSVPVGTAVRGGQKTAVPTHVARHLHVRGAKAAPNGNVRQGQTTGRAA